jgi:hypothetical protein
MSWRTAAAVVHGGCRRRWAAGIGHATAVAYGGCMSPTVVGHDSCFFNYLEEKTHTFAMACTTLAQP